MVRSGEVLSGGGWKNPWDILKALSFSEPGGENVLQERLSKKPMDVLVRSVFEMEPDLKTRTSDMLSSYVTERKRLPFIHITPDIVEYDDGSIASTGNVANIVSEGFLPRDSNVGGFLVSGEHYSNVGKPESFGIPEDFLKSYATLLKHYLYHAMRTNHRNSDLEGGKNVVAIKPAFVLVDGDLKVEHGTDYEDHFILRDGSGPEDIVGVMRNDEKLDLNSARSICGSYKELLNILSADVKA